MEAVVGIPMGRVGPAFGKVSMLRVLKKSMNVEPLLNRDYPSIMTPFLLAPTLDSSVMISIGSIADNIQETKKV